MKVGGKTEIENSMKKNYIIVAILIVFALLLVSVFSFARDVSRFRRNGIFVYHGSPRTFHLLGKSPATLSDVDFLAGWMTLGYINKSFNIPPDYLKSQFSISDKSYPNETVSKIAKQEGTTTSAELQAVKTAVREYLTASTTPNK